LAQAGAISEVVKDLDQLLINHSDDGAEICDAYVNGLLVNGQIDEAKLMIQQWQIAFPSDPQPDNLLGRLAEFYHKTTEAEGHYRHALTKNPQHFPSAYGLGRTLIELNRWQDALEAFRVCLSLPVKAPAQLGMGRCLANIGQDEQAAKLLHAAAEIPRDKLIEALKQLGEPTECDTLSFELGLLESKLGNSAEAVHWFQRAVDNNPQYREARYQLAMSLKGAGRDAEAQIHLDWRAGIQAKLGEIDRLYDAVKSDPNNLDARFRLGLLEREVGSEQSGQFWLRSVLARDPSHSGAKDALDQRP
jgi:tetratricopeptide (TPR) repeat protein